jgi:flagellar basal body-associated protein FliL
MGLALAGFVLADCPAGSVCIESPLQSTTFQDLINRIINIIFIVALALAPIPILIAGYYFISSQGDPKKVQTARNMILYTFIGLGIIFFAKAVQGILKFVIGLK